MSQSEILKDRVSDWPINMPGVSKRTRGNGRNGTEQRALEGMKNTSEWRSGAFRGVNSCIYKDNTTEANFGVYALTVHKQSESCGKDERKL